MENVQSEIANILQTITKKFYLKQIFEIKEILISEEKLKNKVYFDGSRLLIAKHAIRQPLFKEFLIKEIAKTFLPRILINIERAQDFCYYITYKLTKNKKEWLRVWGAESPPVYTKNLTYTPQYDLTQIDNITDGKAVKTFFSFFNEAKKYRDKLSFEEYLQIYNFVQKEITPKLSELEYKVLAEIYSHGELDYSIISKNTGLTVKKVKRITARLKKHLWLNFLAFPNWSKIGLEYIIVLVNPVNENILNVVDKLTKPYVRIIHQLGGGEAARILFICTPPFGTIYVIEKYLRKLEYEGLIKNYVIMRPERFTRSTNLALLNNKSLEWSLNEVDKIYHTPRIYEIEFFYHNQTSSLFDREDIIVLFELDQAGGFDTNLTKISKKTGLSRTRILTRIKKLTKENYYISYPVVYPPLLRLPETLFIIIKTSELECKNNLRRLFLNFPDNYVFELDDGIIAVNHVAWQLSDTFNIVNRLVSKFEGVEDLKLFFEYSNYGSMPAPSGLFKDGIWINPAEFWRE